MANCIKFIGQLTYISHFCTCRAILIGGVSGGGDLVANMYPCDEPNCFESFSKEGWLAKHKEKVHGIPMHFSTLIGSHFVAETTVVLTSDEITKNPSEYPRLETGLCRN